MEGERVYITLGGKSPYALINSYFASLEFHGFRAEKVHVIYDDIFANFLPQTLECMEFINGEYDHSATIYTDNIIKNSVKACLRTFIDIIEEHKGAEIALDITSGRKYMVSTLMLRAWDTCDHIYFLQTDELRGRESPFMLRPVYSQYPMDLKKEVHSL